MNLWFADPGRPIVADAAGSEKARSLPSRGMRVRVLQGDSCTRWGLIRFMSTATRMF